MYLIFSMYIPVHVYDPELWPALVNNSAGTSGAAIFGQRSGITLKQSVLIKQNSATVSGGAIYLLDNTQALPILLQGNVTFLGNAAQFGGAMYLRLSSAINISCCVNFSMNYADKDGGAIYSSGSAYISLLQTSFVENSAQRLG